MEVFLFMSMDDEAPLMEHTLYAWESIDYAFPVSLVKVRQHKFEVERRVLADKMANDTHYVLADIGCVPEDGRALLGIMGRIKPTEGMVGFSSADVNGIPAGIRVCRKGVVQKWPSQISDDYNLEHMHAVKSAGYEVTICPTTFRRLLGC